MPRACSKGYLKLSLVACPVEMFPATSQAEKTHFHQIDTRTGNQLRQKIVDEETGREVYTDHKGRGYELSKGRYVPIDDDELKAIEIESSRTMEPRSGARRAFLPRLLPRLTLRPGPPAARKSVPPRQGSSREGDGEGLA
jgi:Ku protein